MRKREQTGRRYEASHHAQRRMRERYSVDLAPETWAMLAEQIEDWPREATDRYPGGREHWLAWVRLDGPTGGLVVPMVYTAGRHAVVIRTVMPGGFRLHRRQHATSHP